MKHRILSMAVGAALITGGAQAQSMQRRADLRGGGNSNVGKCTIEVVVDGAAQVEVRGDSATLRNLKGNPPQWRRFVCTSPMPASPAEFRFSGVDGRGSQQLIRDPRQGGVAVVEINDPDNGSEGYTFDLTWSNGPGPVTNQYPAARPDDRGGRPDDRGRLGDNGFRGSDQRFTTQQAVEVCQSAVRQQASERFRTSDVRFRQTTIDDAPGRNDWVLGSMEVRQQDRPDQVLKFSCSVDFASGRVRSAQIDPVYAEGPPVRMGEGDDRRMRAAAIQNCERAVEARVRRDGYDRVTFGTVNFDDQPGRSDWVVGDFRAAGRYGPESLRFSCSVEMRDGDVKSVDVSTRER